jgi:hypothetical protein
MKRFRVPSSNLYALAYDSAASTLEVEFREGRKPVRTVWQYRPVSAAQFEAIRDASSIGSMFHQLIRADATIEGHAVALVDPATGIETPVQLREIEVAS